MIKDIWEGPRYTTDELNARLKFFIGIILGLTLFGIVFVVLYSLIFVTQPMNGMSPVDNKFFELIIPIATFLTGTLSGIMLAGDDKDLKSKALDAANKPYTPPPPPPSGISSNSNFTKIEPSLDSLSSPMGMGSMGSFSPSVGMGFGGKEAPSQPPHPEL